MASLGDISCLSAGPNVQSNIKQLVKDKQYDLAIQLAVSKEFYAAWRDLFSESWLSFYWKNVGLQEKAQMDDPAIKQKKIVSIKYLYAFHLYCQFRFDEAFAIYRQIEPGKSCSQSFVAFLQTGAHCWNVC